MTRRYREGTRMSAQPSSPGPAMPEPPDYTRYDAYLAGFTGLDQNEICRWTRQPARRSHIGPRGRTHRHAGNRTGLAEGQQVSRGHRPGAALRRRDRAAAGTCFNQCVLQYFRRRTAEARIRFRAMRGAWCRGMGLNNKEGMMKTSWGNPVHVIPFIRTLGL